MSILAFNPDMSLRSRSHGRERWDVPCLLGQENRAAGVELVLRGEEGVLGASVNPVTGRALITYSQDS
jgi:hypothetical protein